MKNIFIALLVVLISAGIANAMPPLTTDDYVNGKQEKNATATADDSNYDVDNDPAESVNRGIMKFNDVVDTVVYKPVAPLLSLCCSAMGPQPRFQRALQYY